MRFEVCETWDRLYEWNGFILGFEYCARNAIKTPKYILFSKYRSKDYLYNVIYESDSKSEIKMKMELMGVKIGSCLFNPQKYYIGANRTYPKYFSLKETK